MTPLIRQCTISLLLLLSQPALAGEPQPGQNESADTQTADADQSGGFLKIGAGLMYRTNPYNDKHQGYATFINGRYQGKHGLYLEFANGADELNQGLALGWNFYNTPDWHFDLNTVQAHGSMKIHLVNETASFRENRSSSYMLGLRATGRFDDTTLQLIAAPLSISDDIDGGFYASAWLARRWQLRNWQFHASLGLQFRSKEIIEHYYGLPDGLVIDRLSDHAASSATNISGQLGVSYPLSRHWLFESYYRYTDIASEITDSPLMSIVDRPPERTANESEFGIMFSYVF